MDTYIFLTGRIVPGQPIAWNIPPMPYIEPVPQVSKEDADAAFDAPAGMSFLDHLFPTAEEAEQTAEYISWLEDEEFYRRGC